MAHDVLRAGKGPGVIVVHEIPGITPEVAAFARRVVEAGFTVWMPSLLGTPGRPRSLASIGASVARACVSREFAVWASNASSPVTLWLRALARHAHAVCGGPGVGAVGMCLTGNFALSMMVEPAVMAPVLSQPSLPFSAGGAASAGLHLSPEDLAVVQRRAQDDGVGVLGLRFTHDALCPAARFDHLARALGSGFERIDVPSGPGNPWGHPLWAHSVLTNDLIDAEGQPTRAALDRVLALFHERLRPAAGA